MSFVNSSYTNPTPHVTPRTNATRDDRPLAAHHRRMLAVESGISAETIAARGYWTAYSAADIPEGFAEYQYRPQMFPILVIPQWNAVGRAFAHILRPDNPRRGKDGKVVKYEAQPGAPVGFDCPPAMTHLLRDSSIPLYITEGSKKSDAAASRGLLCLSLNGVYGFMHKRLVVSELDEIALDGRVVRIAFDSDVMTNPGVADALDRIAAAMDRRGARVEMVHLPDDGDGKTGFDNYFARGGEPADLNTLTTTWRAVRRPINMIEYADPYAEIERLQRLASAQAMLIKNPYLRDKERALGFAIITRSSEKKSRGDVGDDGCPRVSSSDVANDYRARPEKGVRLAEINNDGTPPITKRSNVKPIITKLRDAGILAVRLEPTTRKHASGDSYADTDFVVEIDDPVNAIILLADYRGQKQRKPYTRQEPCSQCDEVHSRTRRTFCNGCGAENAPPQIIPIPVAQRDDLTDEQRDDLDARTLTPAATAEGVDPETGEIVPKESGSTKKVEATTAGLSPSPFPSSSNYSSTKKVEADSVPAGLWDAPPADDEPDAPNACLDCGEPTPNVYRCDHCIDTARVAAVAS